MGSNISTFTNLNFNTFSDNREYEFKKELLPVDVRHEDVFPTTVLVLGSGTSTIGRGDVRARDSSNFARLVKVGEENLPLHKLKVAKACDNNALNKKDKTETNIRTIFQIDYNGNVVSKYLSCGKCDLIQDIIDKSRTRVKDQLEKIKSAKYTPYEVGVINTNTTYIVFRSYAPDTLASRLHRAPALNDVDKLWIAYQIVCALRDLHANNFCHGCIKAENVLIWACNTATLADPGLVHPVCVPAGNPIFYFRVFKAGIAGCCLAPERVVQESDGSDQERVELTPEMDIFAAGCVIAYMFLNGRGLFDYSTLAAYGRGEYSPAAFIESIGCGIARDIVRRMVERDPQKRPRAEDLCKMFPKWLEQFGATAENVRVSAADPDSATATLCRNAGTVLANSTQDYRRGGGAASAILRNSQLSSTSLEAQHHPPLTVKRRQIPPGSAAQPPASTSPLSSSHPQLPYCGGEEGKKGKKAGFEEKKGGVSPSNALLNPHSEAGHCLLLIEAIAEHVAKCGDVGTIAKALETLYTLAQHVPCEGSARVAAVFPYLWHYATGRSDTSLRAYALRLSASLLQSVPALTGLWRRVVPRCVIPGLGRLVGELDVHKDAQVAVALASTLPAFAEAGLRFFLSESDVSPFISESDESPVLPPSLILVAEREKRLCTLRASFAKLFDDLSTKCFSKAARIAQVAVVESAPLMAAALGPVQTWSAVIPSVMKRGICSQDEWVREAVVRKVPAMAPVLGPTLTESELFPIVAEVGVYDSKLWVVKASLDAIVALCDLGMLRRKTLRALWRVCMQAAFLPSMWVRLAGIGAITAVCNALGPVDTELYVCSELDPGGKLTDFRPGHVTPRSLEKAFCVRVRDKSLEEALKCKGLESPELEEKLRDAGVPGYDIKKIVAMWPYLKKSRMGPAKTGPKQPPGRRAESSPFDQGVMQQQQQQQQQQRQCKTALVRPGRENSLPFMPSLTPSQTGPLRSIASSSRNSISATAMAQPKGESSKTAFCEPPQRLLLCAGGPAFKVRAKGDATVSASRSGTLCIWGGSGASSNDTSPERSDVGGPIHSLALDRSGRAFCGARGTVHVVDIQTQTPWAVDIGPKDVGGDDSTKDIVAMEDANEGVWAGQRNGTLSLLDLRQNDHAALALHGDPRYGLLETFAAVPGTGALITGTSRGYYTLWDRRKEVPVLAWRHPKKLRIRSLAALGGNLLVAAAGGSAVLCWDYLNREKVGEPKIVGGFWVPIHANAADGTLTRARREYEELLGVPIKAEVDNGEDELERMDKLFWARQTVVCASKNEASGGRFFSGGTNSQVKLWDLGNSERSQTLGAKWSTASCSSVSGRVLQVATDNNPNPEKFYSKKGVLDMCLSEDDRKCFVAYGDGIIRVWNVSK